MCVGTRVGQRRVGEANPVKILNPQSSAYTPTLRGSWANQAAWQNLSLLTDLFVAFAHRH